MKLKSVLIIALSARPFVIAAKRAGYTVTAIDAFADQQTVDTADKAIVIDYGMYGFNAEALLTAVNGLDLSQYIGFVYGSGFDAQPELLQQLANLLPLIGNTPLTVNAVNSISFFAALNELNILHPNINATLPNKTHNTSYLQKFAGGCGGTHILFADSDTKLAANHYYQAYVEGRSVSLLFVANGTEVAVIGFNEQWHSATKTRLFRYGGAVNHLELAENTTQRLVEIAKKLTIKFGLVGINSLDAIVKNINIQDDLVYVLEVNPRLSATFDLYEEAVVNLFDLHVEACLKQSPFSNRRYQTENVFKAHAIVYADSDVHIPASFTWPAWTKDTPCFANKQQGGRLEYVKILADQPICSVDAQAARPDSAKQLAETRAKIIREEIISVQKH